MLDRPVFTWTDAAVATLTDHWNSGLSGSQIAAEMGQGLTRNSVIGKVRRLKLPKRGRVGHHTTRAQRTDARMQREGQPKPNGNKGKPKAAAIAHRLLNPAPLPDPEVEVGVDVTKLIGILNLTERTCKWPHGDPLLPGFGFCGKPKGRDDGPYCPEHSERAGSGYGRPRP